MHVYMLARAPEITYRKFDLIPRALEIIIITSVLDLNVVRSI